MADEPTYCLFHCESRPLAIAVDHVAEVIEVGTVVRLSRCPSQVIGLCAYHQQVIPVISLCRGDLGWDAMWTGAGAGPEPQSDAGKLPPARVVLIARTEGGFWGLGIDRIGTQIIAARAARHDPAADEDGFVTTGLVRHGGTDHALLDAEASWRGLRASIMSGYSATTETTFAAGERRSRAAHSHT